jgi:hypothetical protein
VARLAARARWVSPWKLQYAHSASGCVSAASRAGLAALAARLNTSRLTSTIEFAPVGVSR